MDGKVNFSIMNDDQQSGLHMNEIIQQPRLLQRLLEFEEKIIALAANHLLRTKVNDETIEKINISIEQKMESHSHIG